MPALPFKLNQDRRHHIPEQKRKVTNWRDYDESLRRRGSLTVWFSDEAVEAWEAERRTSRGGQPEYSDLAILTALTFKAVFRLAYQSGLVADAATRCGDEDRPSLHPRESCGVDHVQSARVPRTVQ